MTRPYNNNNNTDTVAHAWANQLQTEGHSGHIFFERASIYSYGHHFEIARHITNDVVAYSTASRSTTTSGHQCAVRSAISHKTILRIPAGQTGSGICFDPEENIKAYVRKAEWALRNASTARTKVEEYIEEAKGWVKDARLFIVHFKTPKPVIKLLDKFEKQMQDDYLKPGGLKEFAAHQKVMRKAEIAEKKRRDAKKLKERTAEWDETYAEWKEGKNVYLGYHPDPKEQEFCHLRVREEVAAMAGGVLIPKHVQTSKGVDLPIAACLLLWRKIQTGGDMKGLLVDEKWTVIENNDSYLKVGCHSVKHTEIKETAKELGFTK